MKSFLQKRVLSPSLFFLAVGALIHCGDGDDQTSFSNQGDTAVMSGIVGTWMGTSDSGNTYTLTLCEDKSAIGGTSTATSCQTLHTVKGDGRGKTETVTRPEGCGGCDYDNSAYVTGSIEGDDLASTTVSGQFGLTGGDTNSLGFPYEINIEGSDSASHSLSISGTQPAAGAFDVDSFYYTPTFAPVVDAGDLTDDGDVDASDVDASKSGGATTISNGITFHRVGDAACP